MLTPQSDEHTPYRPSRLLTILVPFLNSDLIDLLSTLWRLGRRIVTSKAYEGMYEVLEHEATLELLDAKGKTTIYHKRQRVRFLQDNVIAFQDQAWGDGEIFADYKCSPGIPVDRYREGYRYRILISLRGTKHRSEVEEFHIERTIKDGFVKPVETFQTDVDHQTHRLILSLIFPHQRPPKSVTLIERNSTRSRPLGPEHMETLPDGRQQAIWRTEKPHLFEAYILRWEW